MAVKRAQGRNPKELAHRWFLEKDPATATDAMFALVASLEGNSTESRRWLDHTFYRMATGRSLPRAYAYSMSRHGAATMDIAFNAYKAPSFNVIASCGSMLAAKISRNRPWILYLTNEGDFKARNRGKMLSAYNDGLFSRLRIPELSQTAFMDAYYFGDGWIKTAIEDDDIATERVLSSELLVDDADSIHGHPRTKYQIRYIHRETLMDRYGDADDFTRDSIKNAPGCYASGSAGASDVLALVEAWHLPNAEEKDGRHCMALPGCNLVYEPWKKAYFPFARMPWEPLSKGYFSKGGVEGLIELQNRINRISNTIDEGQIRVGVPRVLVDTHSKVSAASLANKVGGMVPYDGLNGKPPQFITPPSVAPELYQYRETLKGEAYAQIGVNELSAAGLKQSGINSGEAQRVRHDIESERFVLIAQRYEQFHVDLSKLLMDLAKETKPKVRVPGRGTIREIAWDDVHLEDDEYEPRAFPVSSLPTSPDGRLQRASELRDLGIFSNDDYMRLIGYPDTGAQMAKQTAPIDLVENTLDEMIETGIYYAPERLMGPEICIKVATWRYAYERLHKTPEDRLDLIRRFLEQAGSMLAPPSPTPPPQMPAAAAPAPLPPPPMMPGPMAPLPPGVNPTIQSATPLPQQQALQ